MPYAWVNGTFVEQSLATIPIADAGLLHAAGLFTTMRADDGVVFHLAAHLQRLRDSCETFAFHNPFDDPRLTAAVYELLERNTLDSARLRLTVTRGAGRETAPVPNVFLTAGPLSAYPSEFYERGMTVLLLDEQKLNPYDMQAGHKTLNYFSRLGALRSAATRSLGEALWFNVHNYLQSGSISNVFLVRDGVLVTPPTPQEMNDPALLDSMPYARSAVLPGITRAAVIALAKQAGIPVRLTSIDVHQLLDAHELFLTNSIMRIMPVTRIEKSVVGDDRPGPMTHRLMNAFAQYVKEQRQ